jgi:uncharacterized protein YcnI
MKRVITLVAMATMAVALVAGPAAAHVTLNPNEATKGGFAKFDVRVPTERDDTSTVKVELFFDEEHPFPTVRVKPKEGWDYTVNKRELDEPVEVFGQEYTEAVQSIVWEGGEIAPEEFDEFEISMGPLPSDADELVFKAIQTYDSGEVVRWVEVAAPGAEEPENPAPTVTLIDAPAEDGATEAATEVAGDDDAEDDDEDGGDPLGIAALVVGLIALAVGGMALARGRRTT